MVSLQGSLQSNMGTFVEKHDIDMVVLSESFPRQGGFRVVSVSDWVKSHISVPFIIIRQDAVIGHHLQISDALSPRRTSSSSMSVQLSPDHAPKRKVALAYSTPEVGYKMIEVAKRLVLLPQDELYLVHCCGSEIKANVKKHTKNFLRTISLGLSSGHSGSGADRGAEEEHEFLEGAAQALSSYNAHLDVLLKVRNEIWR